MAIIVMPVFNALQYTKQSVGSLLPGLRSGDTFVIVDNGSEKDTKDYLKGLKSKFKKASFKFDIITLDSNTGFVNAVNTGLALRKNSYEDAVILNNDLDHFPPNWLDIMEQEAKDLDNCGVLGVKQVRPDANGKPHIIHYGAFTLPTMQGWPYHGGEEDIGQCSEPRKVEHVNFAMVLIKSEALVLLLATYGYYLDPAFVSYCEDDDYCLRARLAGFNVWVTPKINITHYTNQTSIENKLSQSDIHQKSMKTYREKWAEFYRESVNKIPLNFNSLACFQTGYATAGRQLIRHLEQLGQNVHYSFLYGTKYSEPACEDVLVEYIRQTRTMVPGGVQIVFGQGDVANKNSGDYKICFTMLETDSLPAEWVKQLNGMDEVWVPSQFNKTTFTNAGVNVPIYVFPFGIDPNYFNPNIKPLPAKYNQPLNFVSVGEWGERKNFLPLIHAFKLAFRDHPLKEQVGLTVRYTNNDMALNPPVIEQLRKLPKILDAPHVRLIKNDNQDPHVNQQIPSYKMGSLYKLGDIFVLPTSGEGFGLPIFEALACGLPVIVTAWSGHVEWLTDSDGEPLPGVHFIDYELQPAQAKCPYYRGANWAIPNMFDLVAKMQYVAENIVEEKQKALETSKYIRQEFSWANIAMKMSRRVNQIRSEKLNVGTQWDLR